MSGIPCADYICKFCSKIGTEKEVQESWSAILFYGDHAHGERLDICDDCTASFKRWKTSRINKEFSS